jgi:hypothetical protein
MVGGVSGLGAAGGRVRDRGEVVDGAGGDGHGDGGWDGGIGLLLRRRGGLSRS